MMMIDRYIETITLVERVHRHFLEVLKLELDRLGVHDLNNVQAIILHNVADEDVSVGELTLRGYYLGSNVSYNLRKMVEAGYLEQRRSPHDRRSMRVLAAPKGRALQSKLAALFDEQARALAGVGVTNESLGEVRAALRRVDHFCTGRLGQPVQDVGRAA